MSACAAIVTGGPQIAFFFFKHESLFSLEKLKLVFSNSFC